MGIGKKSRKVKGKKRQTGRKIRRGTRRNRLGRMSRMKGGSQPPVNFTDTTDNFQTECEKIKTKLETLRGAVKNTLQGEAEQSELHIATLTQQLDQITQQNQNLRNQNEALAARDRGEEERVAAGLVAAQDQVRVAEDELTNLRQELDGARARGERVEPLERELVERELELRDARGQAARALEELQGLRAEQAQWQTQTQALEETRAREQQEAQAREQQEAQEALAREQAMQGEFNNMIDQIIDSVNGLKQTCVVDINAELDALEIELRGKGCLGQIDNGGV